ncbi:MAG TPA: peptidase M54 [Vicinamibacteria bacterium]
MLDAVARQLARASGTPVSLRAAPGRPEGTFDPRRGQHASGRILRWLAEHRPAAARKVLAVTDSDLFMPVLTFVYGEAQLGGAAAVVSTARLADGSGAGRLQVRLLKECLHELGHTFGLLHCAAARCAMRRAANLFDVDAKEARLCAGCRARLQGPAEGSEGHERAGPSDAHPGGR